MKIKYAGSKHNKREKVLQRLLSPVRRLTDMTENRTVMKISSLTKTIGPVVALDNVSLEVRRGDVRGLIGENGSGKSTVTSIFSCMQ